MDRNSRSLFDVVAKGDAETLQILLLEGKEERNVATLAVSDPSMSQVIQILINKNTFF
jgi:hypothetical protein